jgi:hypothetical protein
MCQLAVVCSAGDARYDCLRWVGSVQGAREIVLFTPGFVAVLNCQVDSSMQGSLQAIIRRVRSFVRLSR